MQIAKANPKAIRNKREQGKRQTTPLHQTTSSMHQSPLLAFACPISATSVCGFQYVVFVQKQNQKASPSSLCKSNQKAERKQSSEVTVSQLPPRSQPLATPQLPPRSQPFAAPLPLLLPLTA
ncbi:hypothetical protein SLEP1_g26383 [Rubroshorea leprosula]|uniref:Uncharacterized protein n=1 Tax=Rubroshorea leprosula TaxID=152421 RepID=A0AAV5JW66_9ROSI|nr:hypothetical protein SLEP1_g26383 [Rubroshorea leprosula]